MWRPFFLGLLVGAANLIPGISGGTVFLICGYYDAVMESLASFNARALLSLQWRTFIKELKWRFLLPLFTAIFLSIFLFSHLLLQILALPSGRSALFAAFSGLILSSSLSLKDKVAPWSWQNIFFLLIGALFGFLLSAIPSPPLTSLPLTSSLFDSWQILCGAFAFLAMLLPGISGSYLLVVLGVWGPLLETIRTITHAFDFVALTPLINIGLGMVAGALLFPRLISWLLASWHAPVLALLIGLMLGGMRAIWPVWESPLAFVSFSAALCFGLLFSRMRSFTALRSVA